MLQYRLYGGHALPTHLEGYGVFFPLHSASWISNRVLCLVLSRPELISDRSWDSLGLVRPLHSVLQLRPTILQALPRITLVAKLYMVKSFS